MTTDVDAGQAVRVDDPHLKLVEALAEVRRKLDAGDDDWRFFLLRTFREFSRAIGIERQLVDPIQKMLVETADELLLQRRKDLGRTGRPPNNRSLTLTAAAAAVTVLSSRRDDYPKVGDAEAAVAKASGIQRKAIKNFRDNISRGKVADDIPDLYREMRRRFGAWSNADILKGVVDLAIFVT